jgi:hypothetical protein
MDETKNLEENKVNSSTQPENDVETTENDTAEAEIKKQAKKKAEEKMREEEEEKKEQQDLGILGTAWEIVKGILRAILEAIAELFGFGGSTVPKQLHLKQRYEDNDIDLLRGLDETELSHENEAEGLQPKSGKESAEVSTPDGKSQENSKDETVETRKASETKAVDKNTKETDLPLTKEEKDILVDQSLPKLQKEAENKTLNSIKDAQTINKETKETEKTATAATAATPAMEIKSKQEKGSDFAIKN